MFLALDRDSVRSYDQDGHLHIAPTVICKSAVNDYVGSEIPGCEALGLNPTEIYRVFRPPEEIEKAAQSFVGKPILLDHKPLDSKSHPFRKTIGAVGTDVTWQEPFLKASLTIWPEEAIDLIKSGEQKSLSPGYAYRPVIENGEYNDESFQIRMVDIVFNHLSLVADPRQGDSLVIGDSNISKELVESSAKKKAQDEALLANAVNAINFDSFINLGERAMAVKRPLLSRKAVLAQGAVMGFIQPRLALDAKGIDITPSFSGVTTKNFKSKIPAIVESVTKALDGKFAVDASAEGLKELLDALAPVEPADEAPNAGMPFGMKSEKRDDMEEDGLEEPKETTIPKNQIEGEKGEDADPIEQCKQFLASKLSPEDMATFEKMVGAMGGGNEEAPAAEGQDDMSDMDSSMDKKAKDEEGINYLENAKDKKAKDAESEKMKNMIDKPAMDAALKTAESLIIERMRREARETADAVKAIRPYVGELAVACDSAEAVYRAALKARGVKEAETIHASALPAMLKLLPTAQEMARNVSRPIVSIAQDSASDGASFDALFPDAARVQYAN